MRLRVASPMIGFLLEGVFRIGPLQWGGLAFILRLFCALISSPVPRDDGVYYVAAARDMAHGMGYLLRGEPTAYWPIGYPFFLSLIFRLSNDSLVAAKVAQVLLSTAIVLMGYWIARRLYGREEPARLTAALLAYSRHR